MVTTDISIRDWQKRAEQKIADGMSVLEIGRPFIVCPTCGNKRCPHATDRKFECTNSNEAGQPGSAYA